MLKKCAICEEQIEPTETPHEMGGPGENGGEPMVSHELCYWKATAGMLVDKLSKIEATIENGNKTVAVLVRILMAVVPVAEFGLPTMFMGEDKRVEVKKRLQQANDVLAQFREESEKPHVCQPGCRH